MKPLLLITGFLGAGKTTLLRGLLQRLHARGLAADVILNDYENAAIDAATLREGLASLAPISASCACCDSLGGLLQLCQAAGNSRGDLVLIELNGTADPLPLLETFTLLESRLGLWPRWQIGVVDARHWGRRGSLEPLEWRQIETATHWQLTHESGLPHNLCDSLAQSVADLNPHATRTDPDQLADALTQAIGMDPASSGKNRLFRFRPADEKADRHPVQHLTHAFTGVQVPLGGRFRENQVRQFLEALPEVVIRAKLLTRLTERPGARWLFERTARHPVPEPVDVPDIEHVPSSLVCIGPDLDPEAIRALATAHFGPTVSI
ncbi:MAG: GTP-binding protein [Verrucomicrobiales bacterium]|nr:GTP-binding protein [Verrucomicrobiales bacterium]